MGTAIDKSKNGYTEKDNSGKIRSRTYPEAVLDSYKPYQKTSSDGILLCARIRQT